MTELAARALSLALSPGPAPRQVCLVEGGDVLGRHDGVSPTWAILRTSFAPEAADAIRQQVMKFTRYRRSGPFSDEYFVEFDPLRRKAESKMETGAGFPEQFVSILRMHYAGLPAERNRR